MPGAPRQELKGDQKQERRERGHECKKRSGVFGKRVSRRFFSVRPKLFIRVGAKSGLFLNSEFAAFISGGNRDVEQPSFEVAMLDKRRLVERHVGRAQSADGVERPMAGHKTRSLRCRFRRAA